MMKSEILLLTASLAVAAGATAQATVALSNLEVSVPAEIETGALDWIGKEFTTGSGAAGWGLETVSFQARPIANGSQAGFYLDLFSDSAGVPGSRLARLTGANPTGNGLVEYTYTAPANTKLSANKKYWLVTSGVDTYPADYFLGTRASGDTGYTGLPGWSCGAGLTGSPDQGADWYSFPNERNPMFQLNVGPADPVPEPGQWALMGVTALGIAGYAARCRRAKANLV